RLLGGFGVGLEGRGDRDDEREDVDHRQRQQHHVDADAPDQHLRRQPPLLARRDRRGLRFPYGADRGPSPAPPPVPWPPPGGYAATPPGRATTSAGRWSERR